MPLSWEQMQKHAFAFAKKWQDASNEEADAQGFITAFLAIFGVEDPRKNGAFERKVSLDEGRKGYFDYLWPGRIAIEMKSAGKDLAAAYKQLANYVLHLETDQMPDLLMVSDFRRIELHHRTSGQCTRFNTANLPKYVRHFATLAGYEPSRLLAEQISVNLKAAEKIARLHDAFKESGYTGHDLQVYLVRLVFCFFAEDTGIFPKASFRDLVANSQKDGSDLSGRLAYLFQFLNAAPDKRGKSELLPPWISPEFQYINGGLFADMLSLPLFSASMRQTLLDCCDFDWSSISPAIFGAMFQGVLDANARRELGAHYTSEENILKLIRPLFLDALWEEFERVKTNIKRLSEFHDRISRLRFLDPACGCGNFLIVAYRELRILELEILKMQLSGQQLVDIRGSLKVSVSQFAGMELEEFPCQIAQVGMWLMDHLMNLRVSEEFGKYFAHLPLKVGASIHCCNALKMEWNEVVPKEGLSYIMGNPPFAGRRYRTPEQTKDMEKFFSFKDIDYVACWYYKASEFMKGSVIRTAFVGTNSITQGEQVAAIWKPLFDRLGIHIDFAYRTFIWSNEARRKAHVHCVIVGFSCAETNINPMIFDEYGDCHKVDRINGYLIDAPDVFITPRSAPLCDAPSMQNGNVPLDGDALKVEPEDYEQFSNVPYIKKLIGGRELLHNEKRYVLWLVDANPTIIRRFPQVMKRIELCKKNRLAMKDAGTRKLAETPMTFRDTNNPDRWIALPMVSSERRKYIPMAYLDGETIPTNQVQTIPDATLYHFGVLNSSAHNAWMRAVCGRLKSDYRYSKDIVYNNFPWPDEDAKTRAAIEKTAQAILDARALFPDASLADLYDELTMPPELRKAHQQNDQAVLTAYGFKKSATEPEIVAALMARYQEMVEKGKGRKDT